MPLVFAGLLAWLAHVAGEDPPIPGLVRWERDLLAALGYGLDFSRCAVTGLMEGLAWVSPRTGRAVTDAAASQWRDRLLPLPPFLAGDAPSSAADWMAGLALTGHFLARDAFGQRHCDLPASRLRLQQQVDRLAGKLNCHPDG
jgi:DNA repair protein RecO (recombination protein O)